MKNVRAKKISTSEQIKSGILKVNPKKLMSISSVIKTGTYKLKLYKALQSLK